MSHSDIPPQARRVYFTGALAAVDRQRKHLEAEREWIVLELDQARQECEEQKNQPEGD